MAGRIYPLSPTFLKVIFAEEFIACPAKAALLKYAELLAIIIFPGKVKLPLVVRLLKKLLFNHFISPKELL